MISMISICDSLSFAAPGSFELLPDKLDVAWMAVLDLVLKPTDCVRICENLTRRLKITPTVT
jgi:hypothetical protein